MTYDAPPPPPDAWPPEPPTPPGWQQPPPAGQPAGQPIGQHAGPPAGPPEVPWQRLDPKMLLIDPIRTLRSFLVPLLIAFVGISQANAGGGLFFLPFALAGAIALGILPWLTTRYRITTKALEVHRGLISKRHLTAPLDKIRSVDLEASVLHRIFGLKKVAVGTGVDESRIELDSVSAQQAEELRVFLLRRADQSRTAAPPTETAGAPGATPTPYDAPAAPPAPAQVLARIDWGWLRFAPFSLTRMAVVAGAIGVLFQFGNDLPFLNEENVGSAWHWVRGFTVWLVLLVGLLVGLAVWVLIAVTGYAIQWWNLSLTREQGNLRLTSGLFTTRSTSVEEPRIRGVRLDEAPLLRLVHGAELKTLATGVGSGGVTTVLPPCPRTVAEAVGHDVLDEQRGEDAAHALTAPLVKHGRRAHRRCHTRAQSLTLDVVILAVVLAWIDPAWLPTWPLIVVPLVTFVFALIGAELEYACQGHVLTPAHLVSRHGSWQRTREALERDGIIGWVIQQNIFQRRARLATLIATTAAGSERVEIRDVPLAQALRLADQATPGLLPGLVVEAEPAP